MFIKLSRIRPWCQNVYILYLRIRGTTIYGFWLLLINLNLSLVWRRVWIYHRGHQNPYIEEEQTTQWPKEKVQKDKQRSTKHTHKIKDRVTRTPLKTGCELRCTRRVSSSCSTSGTRGVNLVSNSLLPINYHPLITTKCYTQSKI